MSSLHCAPQQAADAAATIDEALGPLPTVPEAAAMPLVGDELALDATGRRASYASSAGGYALEDDIRAMGDQMKRVLAFCENQAQSPLRLQAKISDLEEQLHQAIAEKNYWMKRCQELSGARPPAPDTKSRDLRTSRVGVLEEDHCMLMWCLPAVARRGV